jgi:hypothetical protein
MYIRRRYRNMRLEELRPRWMRVVEIRKKLQSEQRWEQIVQESDRYRAFMQAYVEGDVEEEEASPVLSRYVATFFSPALKLAANQRSKADGGMKRALAELINSAGSDAEERWLTAALLADIESDASSLPVVQTKATSPSFAEIEAERDLQVSSQSGLLGVGLALVAGIIWIIDWPILLQSLDETGSTSLERTLNLLQ